MTGLALPNMILLKGFLGGNCNTNRLKPFGVVIPGTSCFSANKKMLLTNFQERLLQNLDK